MYFPLFCSFVSVCLFVVVVAFDFENNKYKPWCCGFSSWSADTRGTGALTTPSLVLVCLRCAGGLMARLLSTLVDFFSGDGEGVAVAGGLVGRADDFVTGCTI